MGFGLTASGFILKDYGQFREEIRSLFRAKFGPAINLNQYEPFGQLVDIMSEKLAELHEELQSVHNSQAPSKAFGASLENVGELTGVLRKPATKGNGVITASGVLGTIIPVNSIVSVSGNSDSRFVTIAEATIAAGVNEIQNLEFSATPDAGQFTIVYDGEETSPILFSDNAATIQGYLNALPSLSGVTVSGSFAGDFVITFTGSDGQKPQNLLIFGSNSLEASSVAVSLSFTRTTAGVLPNVDIDVEAESAGLIEAPAGSLTVIETVVPGWNSVTNALDIVPGTEIETDAEYRLRRAQTPSLFGSATEEALRSSVLSLADVDACRVFSNRTSVTDGNGRPPKCFEVIVLGGDEDQIANAIWLDMPAGIESFGEINVSIVDSQGFNQTIKFSRPEEVDIYIDVTLTVDDDYPVGGDDAVKDAIVSFARENFSIGNDVLTYKILCAIAEVNGIIDVVIDIGTTISPSGDANITIEDYQIASFDTSRITVTS